MGCNGSVCLFSISFGLLLSSQIGAGGVSRRQRAVEPHSSQHLVSDNGCRRLQKLEKGCVP